MLKRTILAFACALLVSSAAQAGDVTYVLQTPGVVRGGTATKARAAVETLSAVDSVETDMDAHTVTVAFDDDLLPIDAIIQALNKAGYSVPDYEQK